MRGSFGGEIDATSGVTYLLKPGYVYFSRGAAVVQTVLGNCVSVCLWDKKLHHGGMNNFIYPSTGEPREATARFGNVATATLVRLMEEAGSLCKDVVAQIFGGGSPEGEEWARAREIAEGNVAAARRVLSSKRIKIVSEDVGGHMGRKVIFETASGNVAVLKVQDVRESDWHSG